MTAQFRSAFFRFVSRCGVLHAQGINEMGDHGGGVSGSGGVGRVAGSGVGGSVEGVVK